MVETAKKPQAGNVQKPKKVMYKGREVKHPTITVDVHQVGSEKGLITVALAKKLLEWESEAGYVEKMKAADPNMKEEDIKKKFREDMLLIDFENQPVKCYANSSNRPFTGKWAATVAHDILHRNWADSRSGKDRTLNGETIVIGRTGRILSGQHRLVALVLAWQRWQQEEREHGKDAKNHYYHQLWKEEPSIEGIIVYGVDESPETCRTLDNVRPRSLSDVLFTQPEIFGDDVKPLDRKILTRHTENCIKWLWHRTGCEAPQGTKDPFRSQMTHSESLDFIARHPTLLQCIRYIFELNKEKYDTAEGKVSPLQGIIAPGYAAALLYMMACSNSDGIDYKSEGKSTRSEKAKNDDGSSILNFDRLDEAKSFWRALLKRDTESPVMKLYYCIKELNAEQSEGEASAEERIGAIIKAWNAYVKGEDFDESSLKLEYTEPNEMGVSALKEYPAIEGGIDIGEPMMEERVRKMLEALAKKNETQEGEGKKEEGDGLDGDGQDTSEWSKDFQTEDEVDEEEDFDYNSLDKPDTEEDDLPPDEEDGEEVQEEDSEPVPSPEQVNKEKERIKRENLEKMKEADKKRKVKRGSTTGSGK